MSQLTEHMSSGHFWQWPSVESVTIENDQHNNRIKFCAQEQSTSWKRRIMAESLFLHVLFSYTAKLYPKQQCCIAGSLTSCSPPLLHIHPEKVLTLESSAPLSLVTTFDSSNKQSNRGNTTTITTAAEHSTQHTQITTGEDGQVQQESQK